MHPLVRDGDILLVRPLDGRAVRVGDVVLCSRYPGQVLVHRVVGRRVAEDGVCLTIQGDQLAQPDGEIPVTSVHGRLAVIERGGTRIGLDRPAMRALGGLAAARSRWNVGRGARFQAVRRIAKAVPGLAKYLA
jgi:hypothetical protein